MLMCAIDAAPEIIKNNLDATRELIGVSCQAFIFIPYLEIISKLFIDGQINDSYPCEGNQNKSILYMTSRIVW